MYLLFCFLLEGCGVLLIWGAEKVFVPSGRMGPAAGLVVVVVVGAGEELGGA